LKIKRRVIIAEKAVKRAENFAKIIEEYLIGEGYK